jgi:hypothetical protein
MDWTMLGAIGELAGAAVVAVTVIFLAQQLRLSNRLAQAEAWRRVTDRSTANVMTAATIPEFRSGFTKIYNEAATLNDLDPDEGMAVGLFYRASLSVYEQTFREVSLGILSNAALDTLTSNIYRVPYFTSAWSIQRREIHEDFAAYLEKRYQLEALTTPESAV